MIRSSLNLVSKCGRIVQWENISSTFNLAQCAILHFSDYNNTLVHSLMWSSLKWHPILCSASVVVQLYKTFSVTAILNNIKCLVMKVALTQLVAIFNCIRVFKSRKSSNLKSSIERP